MSDETRGHGTAVGPLVIPVSEAARRLGWGRDRTYAMIHEGRIPTVRIGRRLLVPVAVLDQVVEEEVSRSAAGAPI